MRAVRVWRGGGGFAFGGWNSMVEGVGRGFGAGAVVAVTEGLGPGKRSTRTDVPGAGTALSGDQQARARRYTGPALDAALSGGRTGLPGESRPGRPARPRRSAARA